MTMFLLVCSQLSVCGYGALPEAVLLGCGPCSGVAFPSPNAIEWVAYPFPCVALWASPRALQHCALVGRWAFLPIALFGGTCKSSVG